MAHIENARAGDAGAELGSTGKLNTTSCIRARSETQYLPGADECAARDIAAGPRFDRLVERVHRLGPRPLAELIAEIATATGEPGLIADRLQAYAGLDPEIVRAVGGDRFPTVLGVVR